MVQVFRLLCDPPERATADSATTKFYGVARKGGLVFDAQRGGTKLRLSASPGGWGVAFEVEPDQLEPYVFGQPRASDFPELARYYLCGKATLPNFEQVPPERGLDAIAAGGGMEARPGVQHILLPGEAHTTWARVFVNFTQGGALDGTGYLIFYRGGMKRGPEGSQIAKFALCQHEKLAGAGANPNRGWHPGACTKCGLDMTVDSSD